MKTVIPEIHFTLTNLKTNSVETFPSWRELEEHCIDSFPSEIKEAYQEALNDDGVDQTCYASAFDWFQNLMFHEMKNVLWDFDYELGRILK